MVSASVDTEVVLLKAVLAEAAMVRLRMMMVDTGVVLMVAVLDVGADIVHGNQTWFLLNISNDDRYANMVPACAHPSANNTVHHIQTLRRL